MEVVPTAFAVTRPEAFTLAIVESAALQLASDETSCVLPSAKAPLAENCCVKPTGVFKLTLVTVMEVGGATVTGALPPTPWKLAVIVVEPPLFPVTRPVPLTVAIFAFPEVQVAEDETSRLVPSEKLPVATNCCVNPIATDAFPATETEESVAGGVFPPPPPPQAEKTEQKATAIMSTRRLVFITDPGCGEIENS